MKRELPNVTVALCGALSTLLLVVGCNHSGESSMNSATNAPTNLAAAPADNSANNTRDRNDTTLTPGDQGNSASDRDITQRIRQALVQGTDNATTTNNFSVIAQNVKIITIDGKVTLRGPVKTAVEKNGIEAIAKNIVGDANVDDQLEVVLNQ